jgi:hypothetical protein
MFIDTPREFDSPCSAEECRKRLRESAIDWELSDQQPGAFRATLYEIRDHMYLVGFRVSFRFLGGRAHYVWCKINFKTVGPGTRVSVIFTKRWPISIFLVLSGITCLASTWAFQLTRGIAIDVKALGLLLFFAGVIMGRMQRDQEKQEIMDLLHAVLGPGT